MDDLERFAYSVNVIRLYERAVGCLGRASWEAKIRSGEAGLAATIERAERCTGYLKFGREVDACLSSALPSDTALMVAEHTPELLAAMGVPDLPWLHTQHHVRCEVSPKTGRRDSRHGLTVEQVKMMPELIEAPCAVVDNAPDKRGVVAVLDQLDPDGLPVVMPFNPAGCGSYLGSRLESNFVLSVYGKRNLGDYLDRAARAGRVLYMDKEKTGRLFALSGLQLPETCANLPDKKIIRRTRKILNERAQHPGLAADLAEAKSAARDAAEDRARDRRRWPLAR